MLGNSPVIPVLPTTDIGRAREFYVNTLGLTELDVPMDDIDDEAIVLRSGPSLLLVYQRPTPSPTEHTQAGWMVDDFDAVADGLIAKGVVFDTFPGMPGTTWDARGVATSTNGLRSAWFRDPDGNILAVNQAIPLE